MFGHEVINKVKEFLGDDLVQINAELRKELGLVMELMCKAMHFHMGEYKKVLFDVVAPMLNKYNGNTNIMGKPFSTPELSFGSIIPYPSTWIDFFVADDSADGGGRLFKGGVLLHHELNTLTVYNVVYRSGWSVLPYMGVVQFNDKHLMENATVRMVSDLCYDEATYNPFINTAMCSIQVAYSLLLAINHKNVTTVEHTPSRLMTRLTKPDKCPQFIYKTIKITEDVVRYKTLKGEKHPVKGILRRHEVPSHQRICKSGKVTRVKAHERGNIERGRVIKEYVFVNGKQRVRRRKISGITNNIAEQQLIKYTPSHSAQ